MNKNKTIIIIAAIVVTIALLMITINAIINTKINQIKSEVVSQTKQNIENSQATETSVVPTEKELKEMTPEKRTETLNKVVSSPVNLEAATGISSSSQDTKAVVDNGIIAGVATGTKTVTNSNPAPVSTNVISSGSDLQSELDAIRNKKK